MALGVVDERVEDGVPWGLFVAEGSNVSMGEGVEVFRTESVGEITGAIVAVKFCGGSGVGVGIWLAPGSVAVGEKVDSIFGVTLGTDCVRFTCNVEMSSHAIGVPRS